MARGSGPERWSTGIPRLSSFAGPMEAVGGLFSMSADAVRFVFRRPFQWREFLEQCWFVARVSMAPTLLVAIPFTVLVSFTLNILLRELGAADLSGAGAAFGAVTQVGPDGHGADRGGRGRDGDVRRSGVAHHPRGDRRDGGAGHRPGAAPGDAADAGLRFGGVAAQQPGVRHRHPRRLRLLGVHPGRQPGCVRRGHHAADRGARGDHLLRQGGVVRVDRRAGGLLPRVDHQRRWRQGGRQRRQRDGGVRVHGVVRDQRAWSPPSASG